MKRSGQVAWTVLLVFVIWESVAHADVLLLDVQFPFKAESEEFSAGKYRINADLQSGDIILRNGSTGKAVLVRSTARLRQG